MSKFLEFRKKDNDVLVLQKKTKARLGLIRYKTDWKEPVFYPAAATGFSIECLMDIIHVLRLNKGN